MSVPASIVEIQAEALLRRVAREQESRCRRAVDEAGEQSQSILKRARREARQRVAQAVAEERRAIERAITSKRAALDTDARQRDQARLRELLDQAWQLLPPALEARWNDAAARERWCLAAAAMSGRCLAPGSSYVVELRRGTSPSIVAEVLAVIRAHLDERAEIREVEGIAPGLRLRAGKAYVDATIDGLLASRDQIGADLLAEFDRLRSLQHAEGQQ
jgi:hypothetical protein